MENFGVVPVFTSVMVSFSPGFAVISVTLNFIVSPAVISSGRPSLDGLAAIAELPGFPVGAAPEEESSAGVEQPALETARSRENSVRYRVIYESFLTWSLDPSP